MREQVRTPSLKRLFPFFLSAQKEGPRRGPQGGRLMRRQGRQPMRTGVVLFVTSVIKPGSAMRTDNAHGDEAIRYFRYSARYRPARRAADAHGDGGIRYFRCKARYRFGGKAPGKRCSKAPSSGIAKRM